MMAPAGGAVLGGVYMTEGTFVCALENGQIVSLADSGWTFHEDDAARGEKLLTQFRENLAKAGSCFLPKPANEKTKTRKGQTANKEVTK